MSAHSLIQLACFAVSLSSLAACLDEGEIVSAPAGDGISFWVVAPSDGSVFDPSAVEIFGPVEAEDWEGRTLSTSDTNMLFHVRIPPNVLAASHPRFDVDRANSVRWQAASPAILDDAQCAATGIADSTAAAGDVGYIEVPAKPHLDESVVHLAPTGGGPFEPIDALPFSVQPFSLRVPVRPCLEGWSMQVESWFAPDDLPFGLSDNKPIYFRDVTRIDPETILASGLVRLFVLRKGQGTHLAVAQLGGQIEGRREVIEGFVVTEARGPADLEILAVTVVELDEELTSSGSPETELVQIYALALRPEGFSMPVLLREIDVETARRVGIRSVNVTSDGGIVAVGRNALITASSTSGPFVLTANEGFYGEDFVEIDRDAIRHAIPGGPSRFSFGDAFDGLLGLVNSAPEIGGVFLGAAYDADRDLVFASTAVPRFLEHNGQSWVERFIAVPENAELCRRATSPCGFGGFTTSNDLENIRSPRVDRLEAVPRPSGGILLVFRPRSCRGVFLADPAAQCAIAAPIDDSTILIEDWPGSRTTGHYALDWDGYSGIMAGPNGSVVEITVTPPEE